MRRLALLVVPCLIAAAVADDLTTIKIDPDLTARELCEQVHLATGRPFLIPKEARLDQPLGHRYEVKIPRARSFAFLIFVLETAGVSVQHLEGDPGLVLVVPQGRVLTTTFKAPGLVAPISFVRSPLGVTSAARRADSLSPECVRALELVLDRGNKGQVIAATLLGAFGPRGPDHVDRLAAAVSRIPKAAAAALQRMGYAARRALPLLRKERSNPAVKRAIEIIESAPHPDLKHPARCRRAAPETYRVRFETTKGAFVVAVTRDWGPQAADRFYHLARIGFFNDTALFRVVKGFVVQWGKNRDPAVNAIWHPATIKDDPRKKSNRKGTIAFAQTGKPNTRGTQVFVNLGDNGGLDGQNFVPFGEVVVGMDVVASFYAGYGDTVSQGRYHFGGNGYIHGNFPKLDFIRRATIEAPVAVKPDR